jgi:RNA polymerase sigma-70 factor, ECF subfamily
MGKKGRRRTPGVAKPAIVAHIETTLMSANPVLERPRQARSEGSPQERTGDLYERYYDRVFGYCLYKLGDRQEAEDATQTTFLWVMRALDHGIEPRLEANWLFTIAQNACRARIKTRGRKRQQETLSDPQILEQVAPGRVGVRDELLGLEDALRDMPELQRQAIILREWRGFSYKEIAAELDLTDAAVETLIFRARRSLASRLENPTVQPAKRATLAVNLGWLLSGLKSLFSFGGAANVAALAASAAAVAIGLGVPGDTPTPQAPVVAPPADSSVPVATVPSLRDTKTVTKNRSHKDKDQGSKPPGSHGPAATGRDPSASPALPSSDVVKETTDVLVPVAAPVTDALDETLAGVDFTVADVNEALGPVVSQLPPLP